MWFINDDFEQRYYDLTRKTSRSGEISFLLNDTTQLYKEGCRITTSMKLDLKMNMGNWIWLNLTSAKYERVRHDVETV